MPYNVLRQVTYLNDALIWLLWLEYPLNLQDSERSLKSYKRMRLSFEVIKIYKTHMFEKFNQGYPRKAAAYLGIREP